MADPLYNLLVPHLQESNKHQNNSTTTKTSEDVSSKYLSRLLSLRLSDLTTTEPQSLSQAAQSNLLSLQALSSRSHRTTTISSDHLSTLQDSLPSIFRSITELRESVPALDESAVNFASTYSRSRESENVLLTARKESQLLARQADKLQDIQELPNLLSATIASAGSGAPGSTNYSQALDLFAHIKRLQIIYPDSTFVKSVVIEAESTMKDMTTNLINSLRSQNVRLAAAIRTIGWLRRVAPELSDNTRNPLSQSQNLKPTSTYTIPQQATLESTPPPTTQSEGTFGLLFLTARLSTFLQMTEALAPLRDLADQESEHRHHATLTTTTTTAAALPIQTPRRPSSSSTPTPTSNNNTSTNTTTTSNSLTGTQTERYLKRYIEIFREQSFNTISMYRNIFPSSSSSSSSTATNEKEEKDRENEPNTDEYSIAALPSALKTFPLHLVDILLETLKTYLPNITDQAARESLLMQVLYAANSLGRLGADFSVMIALIDSETKPPNVMPEISEVESNEQMVVQEDKSVEPEWARVIQKHRVQAARLDALAAGHEQGTRRGSHDVAVR